MGESVFAGQSVIITRDVATAGSSTDEENLEDLGGNADLYIFNQDVAHASCRIKLLLISASSQLYIQRVIHVIRL